MMDEKRLVEIEMVMPPTQADFVALCAALREAWAMQAKLEAESLEERGRHRELERELLARSAMVYETLVLVEIAREALGGGCANPS